MSAPSRAVYEDGAWSIDLNPAVAARFKRVFDGVAKFGTKVRLSDSPKNAKDLLWFADRHPIEFDPHIRVVAQAAIEDEREDAVQRILDVDYEPSNTDLAITLRDYQLRSVDLCLANGALLLGDSVGVGKSAQAIGLFARASALPAVVVTLTSLPIQWEREVNRFAPELRTHIVKTSKPYPLNKSRTGKALPYPDVLILSYSKLTTRTGDRSWAEVIAGANLCRTLIFDECQMLRNNDSDRYRAAKVLRESATYVEGLSATPIYNHGGEIHNVVEIIQPGTLGSKIEFQREWCGRGEETEESIERKGTGDMRKVRVADPVALGMHLRDVGVYLVRTRADVGRELPGIQRSFHYVQTDDTLKKMENEVERLCRTLLYTGSRDEKFKAAGELDWRLRRATGLAKVGEVASFTRLLVAEGQKVLLYGWHHEFYDELRRMFADPEAGDLKPAFYTGKESPQRKDLERARFMGGEDLKRAQKYDHTLTETDVLIMSLRAGAGLDGLQKVCSNVVFGELDWSPGVHLQSEGRVFRDGQPLPVLAYYLVSDEGSDPVVLDVLNMKTEQSEGIVNMTTDVAKLQGASPDHMRKLAEGYLRRRGKL